MVLENMAGVQDSLIISRTEAGRQGTAGAWPSNRGVRGLITQVKHCLTVCRLEYTDLLKVYSLRHIAGVEL